MLQQHMADPMGQESNKTQEQAVLATGNAAAGAIPHDGAMCSYVSTDAGKHGHGGQKENQPGKYALPMEDAGVFVDESEDTGFNDGLLRLLGRCDRDGYKV